jgi:lipopolysaccharide export system protein LptA
MKSLTPLRLLALLALFISLAGISPLYAQEQPSSQDPAQAQAQPAAPSQQEVQTFSGKITKSKGDLVLKDEATNITYKLDNSDQAQQYVGKEVKVTGTLDPSSNTIHVSNIEMASSR